MNDIIKYQLKILSIKLRLYGYELNKSNNNNSISILITPYNLIKNRENYENESFDYTNSFKIITNISSKKKMISLISFLMKY